jgi:4-carboxymuconolactone decarboxylase
MSKKPADHGAETPKTFRTFVARYPALGATHDAIADAVAGLGALDARTTALVKIGICVGAGLESALRSHVRRAVEAGATKEQVEQAILLGMNTVGFPRTVAAWSFAQKQFEHDGVGD